MFCCIWSISVSGTQFILYVRLIVVLYVSDNTLMIQRYEAAEERYLSVVHKPSGAI